jgi:transcriptional regulator with XRE-family HTH domain
MAEEPAGSRLRDWCLSRFGKLKDAAAALSISQELLSQYIHGKSLPGNKTQARLRQLGCDIEWLMTGISSQKEECKTEEEAKMLARLRAWGLDTDGKLAYFLNAADIAQDVMRKAAEGIVKYQVKKKKGR